MKKAPRFRRAGNEYLTALDKPYSTPPRPDIHTIKASIMPRDFYMHELPDMSPTHKDGRVDGGLCPFHDDRHAGSFKVNLDNGAFKCYSCGANGGDIVAFLMVRDGVTFPQVLRQLTEDWGVQ